MSDRRVAESTTADNQENTIQRIYVACLASYNSGRLHGTWIDVTGKDEEEVREEIQQMLAQSREHVAEEWAIHDYEGFYGIRLSEYTSIDTVVALADLLEEHGEAYAAFYNNLGELEWATGEAFESAYAGEWDSEVAFAEELMHETHDIPQELENYMDYEAFKRDLFLGGDYWSERGENGKVFIFQSN